ncbi:MAG TPA: glycosyltransferase family 2 protein [Thermoanaerobaculia bacterium]|nr:glycosyltransferase family 2 protein [Thermoanaerobaculia bacterium]
MTSAVHRVAAIVPAYNEEETLGEVLSSLRSSPWIDEIIVVSDGSTDRTVDIARALKLRTIHLRRNHGKGSAMAVGVAHTDADILVFVDGDILNLTQSMLAELIRPVVEGGSDMNVGIRNRGPFMNALHVNFGPLLSGIRCLRREVFEAVPEQQVAGFAIETGLNWSCRQLRCRLTTTVFFHLKHLVKEKKRGLVRGGRARLEMFYAVWTAYLSLQWNKPVLRLPGNPRPVSAELEYINF